MHDLVDGGFGGGLAALGRRLAAWRRAHGGRGRRIPDEMWDAALALARRGDPGSVARALRLNPGSLARRMEADGCAAAPRRDDPPAFVEIGPAAAAPASRGCRIEISAVDGARVSVEIVDPSAVDLATLASDLMRAAR